MHTRSLPALMSALGLLLACAGADDGLRATGGGEGVAPALADPARHAEKQAYFGDLHIHTRWSFDAYSTQVRVGPEDAYRYARGEPIDHVSGKPIQMKGPPLDFMALTEHGTYMGVSASLDDPNHPLRRLQFIQDLTSPDPEVSGAAMIRFLGSLASGDSIPELVTDEVVMPTWRRIAELADRHNVPGEFTSFVAYEYTTMPDGQNLHRNVIFRGGDVPARPFTALDSQNPEDLWSWMERVRTEGDDVLAIPHNGNGSNGLMYRRVTTAGDPIDASYADVRLRNEPISEVMQIKGQSETHPMLSPNDEWADFEIFDRILGRPQDPSQPSGSYARDALLTGLSLEETTGANPYRFGMIGASDGHNASSPVEEDNYTGKLGVLDGTPEARIQTPLVMSSEGFDVPPNLTQFWGAAGLAGVWAESNTREALFDALRAREAFATSGPRIRVRLFAGWDFSVEDLGNDLVARGYRRGVPMGGELAGGAHGSAGPSFLVRALKDPGEAPLARLQIVKGWLEDGDAREKVFDIACADGRAPDLATQRCAAQETPPDLGDCSYDASRGRDQLSAAWTDPEFRATQRAFYYARVLQIPTCRWSTWDALRLGIPPPQGMPTSIQERAVTSPVWYQPG